jgi:hypothetical protein
MMAALQALLEAANAEVQDLSSRPGVRPEFFVHALHQCAIYAKACGVIDEGKVELHSIVVSEYIKVGLHYVVAYEYINAMHSRDVSFFPFELLFFYFWLTYTLLHLLLLLLLLRCRYYMLRQPG